MHLQEYQVYHLFTLRINNIMANLNTHMTHLEDAVFLLGIDETRSSINYLRKFRDMLKGHSNDKVNTTVKWDGAPALFIGKHPETKEFLVAKKSLFNKEPLYYTSLNDIKNATELSSELKKKFTAAFKEFKDSNIPNIIQGDFLFEGNDLKTGVRIDGESFVTFHPNTIVYSVPEDSDLGKALKKKNFGIVFHTTYKGSKLDGMRATAGVKLPKHSAKAWVIDADYKDVTGTATLTNGDLKNVDKHLSNAGKHFQKLGKDVFEVINHPEIAIMATTYTNSFVRGGRQPSASEAAKGFIQFIRAKFQAEMDKRSTEKGKATQRSKMMMILRPLRSIDNKLEDVFGLYYELMMAKNEIIKKMSSTGFVKTFLKTRDGYKVTGQEGFVATDRTGTKSVKLVDRLEFSFANFSKDIIKGWETDLRK
tara:strand:- start:548 stop:1813 length:1266 start_codon:yes stop_codon:yes gene_type:complete